HRARSYSMAFFSRRRIAVFALAGSAVSASAQVIKDGRLIYEPGQTLPRGLTPVESQWLRSHTLGGGVTDAVTNPPIGPVHCQAEYEPQEGIIISWQGNSGLTGVQSEMCKHITVEAASKVWVVVDSPTTQSSANSILSAAGCDMTKVIYVTQSLN